MSIQNIIEVGIEEVEEVEAEVEVEVEVEVEAILGIGAAYSILTGNWALHVGGRRDELWTLR